MKVSVQIKGLLEGQARLEGVGARSTDVRPVLRVIVDDLMSSERRRFATRGNGRWPQLDPSTLRRKAAKGQPSAVLEATGTLKRALTQAHAPGQQVTLNPSELRFGLEPKGVAFYGKFHQKGAGVPKRTLFSVTPTQRAAIKGKLRSYIAHGVVYTHGSTPLI